MSIVTTKVEDLPVVISTYSGHITADEMEQMYVDTENLLADAGDRYYRISDLTEAETSFADYMKMLAGMRQVGKFRTSDPHMQVVFVGNNKWIYNTRNMAAQQGLTLVAFPNIEDAMSYIKLDIDGRFKEQAG